MTKVAEGWGHSLFLKSDGSLWAMGYNAFGQLGDGTYGTNAPYGTNRPEQIVSNGVTAIAASDWSLFVKSDGSLWGMGLNDLGQLGDGSYNDTNRPQQIVAGPPGYNQISIHLLNAGNARLSFVGIAGANYALDSTFNLSPANWMPLTTNSANPGGVLVFTNTPDPAESHFWRIRAVPLCLRTQFHGSAIKNKTMNPISENCSAPPRRRYSESLPCNSAVSPLVSHLVTRPV